MTGQYDGVERELRPEFSRYRRWFRRPETALLAFLLVVIAGVTLRADSGLEILVGAAVGLASVHVGLGWVILSIRTTFVRLDGGRISHRSWFFRETTLVVSEGVRGVFAVYETQVSTRLSSLLILRGDGKRGGRIRLNGAFWNTSDLNTIAEYAGIRESEHPLDAAGFEQRLPGIMNPWERRPVVFGVAGGLLIVLIVIAAVVAVFWLADMPLGPTE